MSTLLTKPLTRTLNKTVKDGGKVSRLEVTLDPHGIITLRPKGSLEDGPSVVYLDLTVEYQKLLYRKHI